MISKKPTENIMLASLTCLFILFATTTHAMEDQNSSLHEETKPLHSIICENQEIFPPDKEKIICSKFSFICTIEWKEKDLIDSLITGKIFLESSIKTNGIIFYDAPTCFVCNDKLITQNFKTQTNSDTLSTSSPLCYEPGDTYLFYDDTSHTLPWNMAPAHNLLNNDRGIPLSLFFAHSSILPGSKLISHYFKQRFSVYVPIEEKDTKLISTIIIQLKNKKKVTRSLEKELSKQYLQKADGAVEQVILSIKSTDFL